VGLPAAALLSSAVVILTQKINVHGEDLQVSILYFFKPTLLILKNRVGL
jgi:hypothetical protein